MEQNKVRTYLLYAVGEILLIVIGILIALTLDNRSTELEKINNFNTSLEQLYTNVYLEISYTETLLNGYQNKMEVAIQELSGDANVPDEQLPVRIEALNSYPLQYYLDNEPIINSMQENIVTTEQNVLMYQVNSYFSLYKEWTQFIEDRKIRYFDELYDQFRFPQPSRLVPNTYTEADIQKALKIRDHEDYNYLLQSLINVMEDLIHSTDYQHNEATALLDYFDDIDYDLHLNFNNIGIIGSALPLGWEESIPMELIEPRGSIWSIETHLEEGFIKFRNGNNWNQNWGATDEYDGNTLFFGRDIPVQEGTYQVILNLSEKRYEIKEIPELPDDTE